MPTTMHGTIWAQYRSGVFANEGVGTVHITFAQPRKIQAYTGLSELTILRDAIDWKSQPPWLGGGEVSIDWYKTLDASGTHRHPPEGTLGATCIQANSATEIMFRVGAGHTDGQCFLKGFIAIDYFE
jgi:hypothetical protein